MTQHERPYDPEAFPKGACYCNYSPLECRLRGHHGTPEMFAEWREPGFPQDRLEAFVAATGWPAGQPAKEPGK